jgi:hypothetical protein
MLLTNGGGTMKYTLLLLCVPPAVTTTGPVVVVGTVAVIWPSAQLLAVALTPPKVTVPVVPKPLP